MAESQLVFFESLDGRTVRAIAAELLSVAVLNATLATGAMLE